MLLNNFNLYDGSLLVYILENHDELALLVNAQLTKMPHNGTS